MKIKIKKSRVIAVVGKGGVGKTTITTLLSRILIESGYDLLLIDADPTMSHLVKSLGDDLETMQKKSLEVIRAEIISTASKGSFEEKRELAYNLDDIVSKSIAKKVYKNHPYSLIRMGQPQKAGCFCPSSQLLREVIRCIIGEYELILIDCEAGLEQIHRKIIEKVDDLIIIADMSIRSIETAEKILIMARKFTKFDRVGVILNKMRVENEKILVDKIHELQIPLFGIIYDNKEIIKREIHGLNLLDIPENSNIINSVREILAKII